MEIKSFREFLNEEIKNNILYESLDFFDNPVNNDDYNSAAEALYDIVAVIDVTTADPRKMFRITPKNFNVELNGDVLSANYNFPFRDVYKTYMSFKKKMKPEYTTFLDNIVLEKREDAIINLEFNVKTRKLDVDFNNTGKLYMGIILNGSFQMSGNEMEKITRKNKFSTSIVTPYFLKTADLKNIKFDGYIPSADFYDFTKLQLGKEKTPALIKKFKLYNILYLENFDMDYTTYKKMYKKHEKEQIKQKIGSLSIENVFKPPFFDSENRTSSSKDLLEYLEMQIRALKKSKNTLSYLDYSDFASDTPDLEWNLEYELKNIVRKRTFQRPMLADRVDRIKYVFVVRIYISKSKIHVSCGWGLADNDPVEMEDDYKDFATLPLKDSSLSQISNLIKDQMKIMPEDTTIGSKEF